MNRVSFLTAAVAVAFAALTGNANAGQRDMVNSCYEMLKLEKPEAELSREVFVIIDQTISFPQEQRLSWTQDVIKKVEPGTAVTVVTFSAFISDRFAAIEFSGQMDVPPSQSERDNLPKRSLRGLDKCLIAQLNFGRQKVAEAMTAAFDGASLEIPRSEIIGTLKDISTNIVAQSPSVDKQVLLISDMLENSSDMSFYARNTVRKIEPEKEVSQVADMGNFGDFGGAKVFVAGAGTIAVKGKKQIETYRDAASMSALEEFWSAYFDGSNATMVVFGKPSLLGRF